MAQDKKSFLLYCDLIHTVEKMPIEKAGELFIHILRYVNDQNPKTNDLIVDLTFEPIKQSLKRDLQKWESELENKSLGGRFGNLKRWNLDLYNKVIAKEISLDEAELIVKNRIPSHTDQIPSHRIASIAVNVSDSDSVIVKENKIDRIVFIEKIQKDFYQSLTPFLKEFGKEVLREFYEYWSEPNKSKTKIKFQLEKTWDTRLRLLRWVSNDFGKKKTEQAAATKSELSKIYKKID